jgi:hypothetical protein
MHDNMMIEKMGGARRGERKERLLNSDMPMRYSDWLAETIPISFLIPIQSLFIVGYELDT